MLQLVEPLGEPQLLLFVMLSSVRGYLVRRGLGQVNVLLGLGNHGTGALLSGVTLRLHCGGRNGSGSAGLRLSVRSSLSLINQGLGRSCSTSIGCCGACIGLGQLPLHSLELGAR